MEIEQFGVLPAVLQPDEGAVLLAAAADQRLCHRQGQPIIWRSWRDHDGHQVIPPGCFVQEHSHDRQVEILFCFEGEGEIEVDGKLHSFVPGTTVVASPWLKHKIINTGARELKMTWTMTPPGLETYFRKIGRPRKAGEAPPAPFGPPKAADDIQRETGFGDLQR
jgi:mannose-6-phosphate isomerase-like protein (cupin superfamily)